MKKLLTAATVSMGSLAMVVMPVMAAVPLASDISATEYDLGTAIGEIINWAAVIAGIIALIYLIMAGIKYITSSGDPGKTEEAQKQIISAIIGVAIVVLAYSLMRFVMSILNVGDLSSIKPLVEKV